MPLRPRFTPGVHIPLAIAVVMLLGGCAAGNRLTNHWKDPAWTDPPMKNVYVVAMRPDPVRRRMWEDGFVAGLARHGVKATASYQKYTGAPPDTQQVIEEVRGQGYDGVVVSMRLPDKTEQVEMAPSTRTEIVTQKRSFSGAYYTVLREIQDPGYTEVSTIHSFQTDVWATGSGGRLVWSGTIETPEDVTTDLIKDLASGKLVSRMSRDGVLPPRAPKGD